MENALLVNFGSNLATMALAMGVYVVYKRCTASNCAVHSAWIDCDSPALKELKTQRQTNILRRAMAEISKETINGSQDRHSLNDIKIIRGHEESEKGKPLQKSV